MKGENTEVMTLSEMAEYLKVSEKTIVRMVHAGKLPGAKVASQWRFMRAVIDDWLNTRMQGMSRKGLTEIAASEEKIVPISELVSPGRIVMDLVPDSKETVLRRLARPLAETGMVDDLENYLALLLEREEMLSTAIGRGLAIPHVRDPRESGARGTCIVIGICRKGTDFGALDEQATHLFALPCAATDEGHLRLVAKISLLFRTDRVVERMISAGDAGKVLEILHEADSELSFKG